MWPSAEERYLDLMKKTLAFLLWPEPPIPLTEFNYRRPFLKRFSIACASRLLAGMGLDIVQQRRLTEAEREQGLVWPGYADTMVGARRLDNIQECVETVLRDRVPGDLIETGVWRGGACILMRAVLAVHGVTDRRVFVADSFEGLPGPEPERYPADAGDRHHTHPYLAVTQEQVEDNFRKYGLLDDQVVFIKGWFRDTLPAAPIERLAVLRLDGDMYGSTIEALDALYPKLSGGGYCIVDDYALPGCRQAVDDYRAKHGIQEEMHPVDWTAVYWRKPAA